MMENFKPDNGKNLNPDSGEYLTLKMENIQP